MPVIGVGWPWRDLGWRDRVWGSARGDAYADHVGRREQHRAQLRALPTRRWAAYLREHSGLPGPRANIELAQAVADEGDAACFDEFIDTGDEYLTFCAVIGFGRLLVEGSPGGAAAPETRL